jgi:nucleotide-binding universal stress UspA family protein
MADLAERAEAVSRLVATLDVSADVVSRYSETAFSEEAVGVRARYADITILGPDLLSDELLRNRVMEGALFLSGRPVLLMPEGMNRATLSPKRVMVAWDSSMEASRAVREALAMLVAAEDVHIVLVDPESGQFEQGDEPGADVAAYLARHGVKLTVDRLPGEGKTIDAVLRSHAMDCGAELIVMGAYGHSRLRERIFGGVTRAILENVSVPVLMAR